MNKEELTDIGRAVAVMLFLLIALALASGCDSPTEPEPLGFTEQVVCPVTGECPALEEAKARGLYCWLHHLNPNSNVYRCKPT